MYFINVTKGEQKSGWPERSKVILKELIDQTMEESWNQGGGRKTGKLSVQQRLLPNKK